VISRIYQWYCRVRRALFPVCSLCGGTVNAMHPTWCWGCELTQIRESRSVVQAIQNITREPRRLIAKVEP
jgi:hypothetical protein